MGEKNWYVLRTAGTKEKKVADYLRKEVERSKDLQMIVDEILVPVKKEIVTKNGKRKEVERLLFPGYVLIQAQLGAVLENIIRNLVVVESVAGSATTAGIGSVVDVEYIEDSEKETYTLTSALESDPMSGKISIESPVGKAIAGHEAGDTVSVMLPDDDHFQIRIVSVTHE